MQNQIESNKNKSKAITKKNSIARSRMSQVESIPETGGPNKEQSTNAVYLHPGISLIFLSDISISKYLEDVYFATFTHDITLRFSMTN